MKKIFTSILVIYIFFFFLEFCFNYFKKSHIEEYKINEKKIAEIRNIINSNPSEDMKCYGYEIVVDSSITEITTQFTFTEKRVKDKTAWKFGTIRIYAQDYYRNGQYITTECYLI